MPTICPLCAPLRRNFSRFPSGGAGVALLLLRAAVACIVVAEAIASLRADSSALAVSAWSLAVFCGLLMFVGLATTFASIFITVLATVLLVNLHSVDLVLLDSHLALAELAVMAAVTAILGPGAISIDSRIFGLREIGIRGDARPPDDRAE